MALTRTTVVSYTDAEGEVFTARLRVRDTVSRCDGRIMAVYSNGDAEVLDLDTQERYVVTVNYLQPVR